MAGREGWCFVFYGGGSGEGEAEEGREGACCFVVYIFHLASFFVLGPSWEQGGQGGKERRSGGGGGSEGGAGGGRKGGGACCFFISYFLIQLRTFLADGWSLPDRQ